MIISGSFVVLLAYEEFSFDRVAILIKQGVCDYLSVSKAGASDYNSKYNLECMSLTTKHTTVAE